jgi:pimeloyl-ACP methyl ester carboxylesterase
MPRANVNSVELYYEDTGSGFPVVFCHEFAGDYRSWDPQVRAFGHLYRCVTYSYRGFPPSAVPTEPAQYSQDILIEDLRELLQRLEIAQTYLVGFSMGGSMVLSFALRYPQLCKAIVVVGAGAGTTNRERFERDIDNTVELLRTAGIQEFAKVYAEGPSRQPFKRKDPHGWTVFRQQLAEHDATGQALTMLGVQRNRPTIYDLDAQLPNCTVPALIVIGDEDEGCVDPAVFLKRRIPSSGLFVVPQTGHAVNLEEPALFNSEVLAFFRMVETDRWVRRSEVTTSMLPNKAPEETINAP